MTATAPSAPQSAATTAPTAWVPAAAWAAQPQPAVNDAITGRPAPARKRVKRDKSDPDEFRKFTRRLVRAYVRRVAATDATALRDLMDLHAEVGEAVGQAARSLNAGNPELGLPGLSWSVIAGEVGLTKMAAYQRWAK